MTNPMAIIILAAGEGTRMRSTLPKVLHPVCGKSMIGHAIDAARALSPANIMVVTSPAQESVREYVAGFDGHVTTCIQKKPQGTGDAVRAGLEGLADFGGPVVIAYGDMPLITPAVLKAVFDALPKSGDGLSVLGFQVTGDHAYGRLVQEPDGALARIVEARDASEYERAITLCNSGLMAASSAALLSQLVARLDTDNAKGEYYLTDVIGLARTDNLPCAVAIGDGETLMGVNSRAELAVAERVMQTRLRTQAMDKGATLIDPSTVWFSHDTMLGRDVVVGPNVWFGPNVVIADNVEIRPNCHIEGASVGEGAIIGPFARLRPGADVRENAHIGNFVEIKAALIEPGAKINHLYYIGDARVGADTNIGAGTITCNYDGYNKFKTDIGAGVFVGSNTAMVAPVVVHDGAVIGAGSVVTSDVPKDALYVSRGDEKIKPGGGAIYRDKKSGKKD
ncbi:MAG: bifunctional UDP-N-acetylglucosamine diphosphorylase/glucosamine-1-phosphate N-acetyltransferase GlmU [Rhodospirillales bacterium]|nr:bifunctional UDP-N-acetylglucosamine diphosphorylase/glucosamine-1-phosphate N-acetyltransferase GlmU [Rhodospirillales bacterium]